MIGLQISPAATARFSHRGGAIRGIRDAAGERRDSGQNDLFRTRLDQIVDTGYPPAKLARSMDCGFLPARFGAAIPIMPAARRCQHD
jgi:hypothetical protein